MVRKWNVITGLTAVMLPLLLVVGVQGPPAVLQDASERTVIRAETIAEIREGYRRQLRARPLAQLPIGVFDSGTGGLALLEQILTIDAYHNGTASAGSDGKPDFANESFVFLADQANMPYGNYPVVGKTRFLESLIVQDARFLMGSAVPGSVKPQGENATKAPAKAVVIACNTATAYGKDDIAAFIRQVGVDVQLVGVIDTGAKDAVALFRDGAAGTIGVMATQGTVLSGAYRAAISAVAKAQGIASRIAVVQQGALGLAGAIDNSHEFLDRRVRDRSPRPEYRGPSLDNPEARIEVDLLPRYDFDFSDNGVLREGDASHPSVLQLNSIDNYIAYHVVTMLEKLRRRSGAKPLKALILGCTHFPFYADAFQRELARLYDYQENGRLVYRHCLAAKVQLIDPGVSTAQQLYRALAAGSKLRKAAPAQRDGPRARFYISVPNPDRPGVQLNPQGWFTYDYKYGRRGSADASDVRYVPFRSSTAGPEVTKRLSRRVPFVWRLLTQSDSSGN